jgi:hypothetical protein
LIKLVIDSHARSANLLFQTIDEYGILQELQKHGNPDIVMALVGNKADFQEKREVPVQVSAVFLNLTNSIFPQTNKHSFFYYIIHPFFVLQDDIDYVEKNGMFFYRDICKDGR